MTSEFSSLSLMARQILNVLICLLISRMLRNKRENFFRYQTLGGHPADLANATLLTQSGHH
jgi:hypothetical protein